MATHSHGKRDEKTAAAREASEKANGARQTAANAHLHIEAMDANKEAAEAHGLDSKQGEHHLGSAREHARRADMLYGGGRGSPMSDRLRSWAHARRRGDV